MIVYRKPAAEDLAALALCLRPEILATIEAWGDTPANVIEQSVRQSIFHLYAEIDGEPGCLWGLAAPVGPIAIVGVPWLMTTRAVDQHRRTFLRESRRFVAWCAEIYPRLEAFCDARHVQSVEWLKRLGFTVYEPQPLKPGLAVHLAVKES